MSEFDENVFQLGHVFHLYFSALSVLITTVLDDHFNKEHFLEWCSKNIYYNIKY